MPENSVRKGDTVCWLDRAKPDGLAGWQKVGTVIDVQEDCSAHIRDDNGQHYDVDVRELTVMKKKPTTQAERIIELEEENRKLRAELSNIRSQCATLDIRPVPFFGEE